MQIGFDPISAAIAAVALGFALWERRKRRMRERLHIRVVLDVDETGEISVRLDLTNREPTAVFPDFFTIRSGDYRDNRALGLLPEAINGIPSGKHWREYLPFDGDPTEPYRWSLRLQDGRVLSGSGHQLAQQLRDRGPLDRTMEWLRGHLGRNRHAS